MKKILFSLTLLSLPAVVYGDCNTPSVWTGASDATWDNSGNWENGCIPEDPADTAIFNNTATTTSVTQNAGAISLDEISFATKNYTITGTGGNTITFSGNPATIAIIGSTAVTETLNVPITITAPSATISINPGGLLGTLTFGDSVTLSGSTLENANQGSPNIVNFNSTLTLDPSTFINSNTQNYTNFSSVASDVNVATPLTIGSGSEVENINAGTITGGASGGGTGAGFEVSAEITVSGGDLINNNQGSIDTGSSTTTNSTGAALVSTAGLDVTSGVVINQNSGPVNGITTASQSNTGAVILIEGLVSSAGTIAQTNLGTITNGAKGTEFITTQNLDISGSLLNRNEGPVTDATGSVISCQGTLNLSSGSVVQSNSSSVTTTLASSTAGEGCTLGATNINITGGTLTNSNSGVISGTPTNPSFASIIQTQTLTIAGGTLINDASSSSVDANSFGDLVIATTAISIGSNGQLFSNNNPQNGFQDMVQSPTITVNSGGTLAGTGLYTGVHTSSPSPLQPTAVSNSGVVEPFDGSTPGTLTINGNYTQSSSGTLVADLLNANAFSQLNVIGSAGSTTQLNGTLEVNFLPDTNLGNKASYVLVQTGANNTLSGTFSTILYENLPPGLTPRIQYILGPSGEVILDFTTFLPNYAGGYLNTVLSSINHINSHLGLRMEELRRHFSSFEAANPNLASRQEQITDNLIASSSFDFLMFSPQMREKQEQLRRRVATEKPKDRPWNFYLGPTGRAGGELHTRGEQPGLNYWSVGALAGFDYAFSQVGVGFMADYDRITAHAKQHWGKIIADELHASAYTTYAPSCLPELALNGIVGGAYEWYSIRRNAGAIDSGQVAKGKPRGAAFDALVGVEYALANRQLPKMPDGFEIIPMASIQYIYLRADGYKEHGGGIFDMNISSQRIKSLRSGLGLRVNYNWELENFSFVPEIYGEWQREYLNKRRHIGFAAIEFDTSGTLVMPGSGRNIALAGVDLLFTLYERYGIEANYEFEHNSLYHDHFLYFGTNFRF